MADMLHIPGIINPETWEDTAENRQKSFDLIQRADAFQKSLSSKAISGTPDADFVTDVSESIKRWILCGDIRTAEKFVMYAMRRLSHRYKDEKKPHALAQDALNFFWNDFIAKAKEHQNKHLPLLIKLKQKEIKAICEKVFDGLLDPNKGQKIIDGIHQEYEERLKKNYPQHYSIRRVLLNLFDKAEKNTRDFLHEQFKDAAADPNWINSYIDIQCIEAGNPHAETSFLRWLEKTYPEQFIKYKQWENEHAILAEAGRAFRLDEIYQRSIPNLEP